MNKLTIQARALFAAALLIFISNLPVVLANTETNISVPAGTRVSLLMPNTVASNTVKATDSVAVSVAEDVIVDGKVIVSKGSPASLNVEKARTAGHFGRPGMLTLNGGKILDVSGNQIPLNISYSAKGRSRRPFAITMTIVSIPLILVWVGLITLPIGIMASGKDAKIGEGLILESLTTVPTTVEIKAD